MGEDQLRDHGTRLARVEQRVEDLALTVRTMAPLVAQHAQMDVRFGHLEEELHACRSDVQSVRTNLEHKAEQERQDRADRQAREESDKKARRNVFIAAGCALVIQIAAVLIPLLTGGNP